MLRPSITATSVISLSVFHGAEVALSAFLSHQAHGRSSIHPTCSVFLLPNSSGEEEKLGELFLGEGEGAAFPCWLRARRQPDLSPGKVTVIRKKGWNLCV